MIVNPHTEALRASAASAALKSGKEFAPKAASPHRRQSRKGGDDGDDDGDDAPFDFWRFADLHRRRIVTDRADLWRKQKRGFPRAVKLSAGINGVALFPKAEVIAWVKANMRQAEPIAPEATE